MIFISFFVDGGPEPDYDAERRFRFFFFCGPCDLPS